MKTIADLSKKILPTLSEPKVVHMMAACGFYKTLKQPTLSTELSCLVCNGQAHMAVFVDPKNSNQRVWICADGSCESNETKPRRWPSPLNDSEMQKYKSGHPDFHDKAKIV